ncbi:MAG: hypothetical protein SD837_05510 [Candidatus Electrothrix scaldis]|nr:MAG: hypothetical protein SD837_05510 [Candidatus Electrothrix sp. GW3-3]
MDDALEPVEPSKGSFERQHYFVGDPENAEAIRETESRRVALYKAVVGLVRAYANLANEIVGSWIQPCRDRSNSSRRQTI